MTAYGYAFVVISLVGFIPGLWFAWSWGRRVPRPFGWAAFDAGGWVVAFLVIYVYTGVGYLTGEFVAPVSPWQAAGRLALGVIVDLVIIARVIRWRRLSREYRKAGRHELTDVTER